VASVLGLAAGLALAGWVISDTPVLDLPDDEIRILRRGKVQRIIPRNKVDAVYRRGSQVVTETGGGRKLFEGEEHLVRDAFLHGFPWEGPRD
jgi:hypothetical protein